MRFGVVCEGSNDFLALREIIKKIALERGVEITAFDPIQPGVDATSSRQIGGGGWHRVKVWLEDNSSTELKKVLSPQLFSRSQAYDILVIHLDGDVVWLSNAFSAQDRAACFQRADNVVALVEKFIEETLNPPEDLDDRILYAVPVMHTESWLVAASLSMPPRRNLEHAKIKKTAQRYLIRKYGSPLRDASLEAATKVAENLSTLKTSFHSLDHFAKRVSSIVN